MYTFDAEFLDDRKSDLHHPPIARVYLKQTSGVHGSARHYITQDCMTESEFNFCIDRLIGELEVMRTKVHAKFANIALTQI